jgi:hypothetical protein
METSENRLTGAQGIEDESWQSREPCPWLAILIIAFPTLYHDYHGPLFSVNL